MKYQSTRGGASGVSFSEVLLSSYAPDGGLYVPETVPQVGREQLRSWASLGYLQLQQEILSLFVSPEELSRQEMQGQHTHCSEFAHYLHTFSAVIFPLSFFTDLFSLKDVLGGVFDNFDTPQVLPVVQVGPVHVMEAWHGPTGVFKDLTLPALARLCNHFLEKRGRRATVLVSTTGDTGGTTIRSALGMKNLRAIVAYPRHTVSRVQELQMTATGSENAVVFSHDGTADEIDLILRNIFRDRELQREHFLLSFNSIHTVRVILNVVHYFYTYLRVAPNADKRVLVSVPTGGMGNAAGGVIAAEMGLPIRILSAVVTENDIAHRAFSLGGFSITGPQIHTHAPSLDTNLPHNIERVFYYALLGDTAAVKKIMEDFERTQKSFIPVKARENFRHLFTASVNREECLETVRQVWGEFGYALCPHSAVAWKPAVEYALTNSDSQRESVGEEVTKRELCREKCEMVVVMATATAAKFPEMLARVGVSAPSAAGWVGQLEGREERKLLLNKGEDWEKVLRQTIASSQGFV